MLHLSLPVSLWWLVVFSAFRHEQLRSCCQLSIMFHRRVHYSFFFFGVLASLRRSPLVLGQQETPYSPVVEVPASLLRPAAGLCVVIFQVPDCSSVFFLFCSPVFSLSSWTSSCPLCVILHLKTCFVFLFVFPSQEWKMSWTQCPQKRLYLRKVNCLSRWLFRSHFLRLSSVWKGHLWRQQRAHSISHCWNEFAQVCRARNQFTKLMPSDRKWRRADIEFHYKFPACVLCGALSPCVYTLCTLSR